MTLDQKEHLQKLVSESKIQIALEFFMSIEQNRAIKKEVILLSSRLRSLKRKRRLGIISFEKSNVQENKISASLLDLINTPHKFRKTKKRSKRGTKLKLFVTNKFVSILIVSIIALLCYNILKTKQSTPQLTLIVTDINGNKIAENEGKLNLHFKKHSITTPIGKNGIVTLNNIKLDGIEPSVFIELEAKGLEIVHPKNTVVFTKTPIRVMVKRNNELGIIKGVVRNRNGQKLISGATVWINSDTMTLTNKLGAFKLLLPEKMRVQNNTEYYQLFISKKRYKINSTYYLPNTHTEIRLEKK